MKYKGIVQKGRAKAKELGYPTVNVDMGDEPVSGIFAAMVIYEGVEYPAAAYADPSRNIVEAHVLDESLDLYGKEIEIELLEKIRDDEQFSNEESLKVAIAEDVAKIRKYFTA